MQEEQASKALGLVGKSAIVTGASRGIGEAITKALVDIGVGVVGVARNFSEAWAQGFDKGRTISVTGDVSNIDVAQKALKTCLDYFGRIDILVNNAGIVIGGTILDLKMEDWDRQMDVNLKGHLNFSKVVSEEMVKRKTPGRIINISSVAGMFYEVGLLSYSATKGAIISFTRGLAIDLAPYNILVNSVAPGWVDTQMGTGTLSQKQMEAVNNRIPLRHIASPAEVAGVVVFLASDLSRYVTGQTIVVDGGQTIDTTIPGIQY